LLGGIAKALKDNFNNKLKVIVYSNKTSKFETLADILFKIGRTNNQQ
jgi:hypothetical protein